MVDVSVVGEEFVDTVVETFAIAVLKLTILRVGSTDMVIWLVVKTDCQD